MLFCCLLIFFKINFLFFEKLFQQYHRCQTVCILIRPDILSGLILVQTVCKSFQQTTQVCEELTTTISKLCLLPLLIFCLPPNFNLLNLKKTSEYDQEMPQLHITDQLTAPAHSTARKRPSTLTATQQQEHKVMQPAQDSKSTIKVQ